MSVSASVKVTITVQCASNWGPQTTMAQIHKQALEDLEGVLRQAAEKVGLKINGHIEVLAVNVSSPQLPRS